MDDAQDHILPYNSDYDEEILTRHENVDDDAKKRDNSWAIWNVKLNDWVEVLKKEMNDSKSVLSHEVCF